METREQVFDRIREHLPFGLDPSIQMSESSTLSDLGLSSLHLLTLVMSLRCYVVRDYYARFAWGKRFVSHTPIDRTYRPGENG